MKILTGTEKFVLFLILLVLVVLAWLVVQKLSPVPNSTDEILQAMPSQSAAVVSSPEAETTYFVGGKQISKAEYDAWYAHSQTPEGRAEHQDKLCADKQWVFDTAAYNRDIGLSENFTNYELEKPEYKSIIKYTSYGRRAVYVAHVYHDSRYADFHATTSKNYADQIAAMTIYAQCMEENQQ